MKIAFICTEMLPVPPIRGGAIQILIDGVKELLSQNNHLTIYSIADRDLPDREVANGIEYIRIPQENYTFGVAKELSARNSCNDNYDVIHVFNRPRDLLIYKAVMPESRFIISLHNEMYAHGKISESLGDLSITAADLIMTISDYIGKTITSRFPSAKPKVKTVYSGIDLKRYKPVWEDKAQSIRNGLHRKYGLENKKVILYVGRLCETKGPDIMIRAMEHVTRDYPNAVLVIVGSKWFSDESMDEYGLYLRRLARSYVDRVIFTGFVPPGEIHSFYLLGDIFVCSSQWQEPLARVHYEAMGAGLPVITTNRGGNAEIMHGNGIVIEDYSNPLAFANAISYLLSNPAYADKMARNGRAFVEADFGFEHVARRLENLYLKSLG